MNKKVIIISAPSGAGKSTIVRYLLQVNPNLSFSVSATTRLPRPDEKEGVHYHFISVEEFRARLKNNEFIEHEEVYNGTLYGTLKSEVERIWQEGKAVIFDVDVKGGVFLKNYFKKNAFSLYIKVPDVSVLVDRLSKRSTESGEDLKKRVEKAAEEMRFEDNFDVSILNDNLDDAKSEAERLVNQFLG